MLSKALLPLIAVLLSAVCHGQALSNGDKQVAHSARGRYYNLEEAGFQSLSCAVKFDFSTVPQIPSADNEATGRLIRQTNFNLTLDEKGPRIEHKYPASALETAQQQAAQTTNLLTSLIGGIFQTWPTKGLQGPIPPFDSQIASVASTADGYLFNLRVPGDPVQVFTDKNYLVTTITSIGGKVTEHPSYAPSPEGLVFVGNDATDDSGPGGRVAVKYQLGVSVINGLRVPTSVSLQVNGNIDVKFVLEDCSVKKAIVVHLLTPPHQ